MKRPVPKYIDRALVRLFCEPELLRRAAAPLSMHANYALGAGFMNCYQDQISAMHKRSAKHDRKPLKGRWKTAKDEQD